MILSSFSVTAGKNQRLFSWRYRPLWCRASLFRVHICSFGTNSRTWSQFAKWPLLTQNTQTQQITQTQIRALNWIPVLEIYAPEAEKQERPATCRDYISNYISSASFKFTTYCSSYHLMPHNFRDSKRRWT
jgi:hypothetical protein